MFKYSIFIPAYNAYKFIGNFSENIKRQIIKPDQIIIVDDTRNTENFEKSVREKLNFFDDYKKLLIIKNKKNLKPSLCWNKTLKLFSNNLVFRMDVDDFWEEDHTKKMLDFYSNNKNAAIYLQKYKCNFIKKKLFNSHFLFINLGLHSSCLFNFNVAKISYPVTEAPLDDLYKFIKTKYILKHKIKFVDFNTCRINIYHSNRWSNNTNRKKTIELEKKLYFLVLKKFLNKRSLNFWSIIKIIKKLNFLQSIFVFYKILSYYLR